MKGALQIMIVAIGALVMAGIAIALWNASQADGTVVEAFSVPPTFAQEGIGGDVVANDITNKLSAIRDIAEANSLSRSRGVRRESAALTVTVDGQTQTVTGSRDDLDRIEQKAAEWVFATVDPANIVLYWSGQGRDAEALAAAARFAHQTSNTACAGTLGCFRRHRLQDGGAAHGAARHRARSWARRGGAAPGAYHSHQADRGRNAGIPEGRLWLCREVGRFALDTELGDFTQAMLEACEYACTPASALSRRAEYAARLHDPAKAQDLLGEARAMDSEPGPQTDRALYFSAAARSDWPAAVLAARAYRADVSVTQLSTQTPGARLGVIRLRTQVWPLLAVAFARSGDVNAALIDRKV